LSGERLAWTDVGEIGFRLAEAHPSMQPLQVRFTELRDLVLALPGFTGDPKGCNEKILEAIQMAWLDERDE
jgi:FeS assembly protein IscX